MPIEKKDLRRCLVQKFGFEQVPGTRHDAVALFVGGRKVATTRFSRGHDDINPAILSQIAKQIWVQLAYLQGMYDCHNSRQDYIELLRQSGRI